MRTRGTVRAVFRQQPRRQERLPSIKRITNPSAKRLHRHPLTFDPSAGEPVLKSASLSALTTKTCSKIPGNFASPNDATAIPK